MFMNFNDMSNAELRVRMKEMENEYEALQNQMKQKMERMQKLDKEYNQIQVILAKRNKGII